MLILEILVQMIFFNINNFENYLGVSEIPLIKAHLSKNYYIGRIAGNLVLLRNYIVNI